MSPIRKHVHFFLVDFLLGWRDFPILICPSIPKSAILYLLPRGSHPIFLSPYFSLVTNLLHKAPLSSPNLHQHLAIMKAHFPPLLFPNAQLGHRIKGLIVCIRRPKLPLLGMERSHFGIGLEKIRPLHYRLIGESMKWTISSQLL